MNTIVHDYFETIEFDCRIFISQTYSQQFNRAYFDTLPRHKLYELMPQYNRTTLVMTPYQVNDRAISLQALR